MTSGRLPSVTAAGELVACCAVYALGLGSMLGPSVVVVPIHAPIATGTGGRMKTKHYLKAGNIKIAKSCGVWCLPTATCGRECPGCYAKKAEKLWPNVTPARVWRLEQSLHWGFVDTTVSEILRRGFKTVRIHESGDFYSNEYIAKWAQIVKACPGVDFYGYTKCGFDVGPLDLPNCNIIRSDGLNYGTMAELQPLLDAGYKLCPATVPGDQTKCMQDCVYCLWGGPVCFIEH